MRIAIIVKSESSDSNTATVIVALKEQLAQHEIEVVSLDHVKIAKCFSCRFCYANDGRCAQKNDDAESVFAVIQKANVAIFVSPKGWFQNGLQFKSIQNRILARGKDAFQIQKTALIQTVSDDISYDDVIYKYHSLLSIIPWDNIGEFKLAEDDERQRIEECASDIAKKVI